MVSRLKKVARALSAVLVAALIRPAFAETPTLVIGAVVSQTGAHAAAAAEYQKGLMLWRDEVKAFVPRRNKLEVFAQARAFVLAERDAEGRGVRRQRFVKLVRW